MDLDRNGYGIEYDGVNMARQMQKIQSSAAILGQQISKQLEAEEHREMMKKFKVFEWKMNSFANFLIIDIIWYNLYQS